MKAKARNEREMIVLALPNSSRLTVILAILSQGYATLLVAKHPSGDIWLALLALSASAYLADLCSGLGHFSFDYVFPDRMPIFGPIAVEFRLHHEEPTLDPSLYWVNYTKGAYASLPVSVLACILNHTAGDGALAFWLTCTAAGTGIWALFFHQIHSYAHMGSYLTSTEFNRCVAQIRALPTKRARINAFRALFAGVPIPPAIRLLQDCRILLNPGVHNLHHLDFETNFSSVNGWSDSLCDLFLTRIARLCKAKAHRHRLTR